MLMEHLRERHRRLIADAGRNPGDGFVARFEHERGLVHPARDQVTVHGGFAGMHNGFGDRCEDFRERHRFGVGLGFGYYPYRWITLQTMDIMAIANPTPRRSGTTVPILPVITPM